MIRGIPGNSVVSCGHETGRNADDKIPACRYVPGLVSDLAVFSSRLNDHQELPAGFIMHRFSSTWSSALN